MALTDPAAPDPDLEKMPAVCWIGHSIHGNEPSGANASLLSAYYLAAAQGPAVDQLLENTVILLIPLSILMDFNAFQPGPTNIKARIWFPILIQESITKCGPADDLIITGLI